MLFYKSYQHLFIMNLLILDKSIINIKKKGLNLKLNKNSLKLFPKKIILSHSTLCDKKGSNHFRFLDSLIFLKKITGKRSCIKKYIEVLDNNSSNDILNNERNLKFLVLSQVIVTKELLYLFLNYLKFVIFKKSSRLSFSKKKLLIFLKKKSKFSNNLNVFNLYIANLKSFCGCSKRFNFLTRRLSINLHIRKFYKNQFKIKKFWNTFFLF